MDIISLGVGKKALKEIDELRKLIAELQSSGGSLVQVTKLGITGASGSAPKIYEFPIAPTTTFNRAPIEVLKFVPGTQNVVTTISDFNNADATSFEPDPYVVFDGTMKLKTVYQQTMTDEGVLGSGRLYSTTIDKSQFKSIEKIEVL